MRIRHLHLPNTTYAHTSLLQSHLVSSLLASKSSTPPPPATILTFETTPTYTTGRRDLKAITASQIDYLSSSITFPARNGNGSTPPQRAKVVQAMRGGQTTFHGPGQLVAYPILDLRSPALPDGKRPLRPKCYVDMLEETTIRTLARWGVKGIRTENPGVWVDEMRKIAALGVHVQRGVTAHGVGLNVSTEIGWFERIVACGLVGRGAVNMMRMRRELDLVRDRDEDVGVQDVGMAWVEEFSRLIGGVVENVEEEDVFTGKEREMYLSEREELFEREKSEESE